MVAGFGIWCLASQKTRASLRVEGAISSFFREMNFRGDYKDEEIGPQMIRRGFRRVSYFE